MLRSLVRGLAIVVTCMLIADGDAYGQDRAKQQVYQVKNVDPDDVLNLRKQPNSEAPIVGRIPFDATGIVGTGQTVRAAGQLWFEVSYEAITGWINARYVKALSSTSAAAAQSPLEPTLGRRGQCLHSIRPVDLDTTVAPLARYHCRLGDTELGVEFHTLSDVAASAILSRNPTPTLRKILSDAILVRNDVLATYQLLLNRFAVVPGPREGKHLSTMVRAPASGEGGYARDGILPSFREFFPAGEPLDMPLPDDLEIIKKTNGWPSGYTFMYGSGYDGDGSPRSSIWRFAAKRDIANFSKNWKKYNQRLDLGSYTATPNYIRMMEFVGKEIWPTDFLLITRPVNNHCADHDFNLYPRRVLLNIALITNHSPSPMAISRLLGKTIRTMALRPISPEKSTRGPYETIATSLTLDAHKSVLIPLRIVFGGPAEGFLWKEDDLAGARETFARIQQLKPGTLFEEVINLESSDGSIQTKRIVKAKESFGPPAIPSINPYVYGPEIQLMALEVNGDRVVLNERPTNFLDLSIAAEGGSCPYLYAWSSRTQKWMQHGKVIHRAMGKRNAMTEKIDFEGLVTRFRLAERELEVAYIDQATLLIRLKDGSEFDLKPQRASLRERDGKHLQIVAGQVVEFGFRRPQWVDPATVVRSSLMISGYYERYSNLLLTRRE